MPKLPTWTAPAERQPGWEHRFVAVLQRHMERPFAWGKSDCGIVVADVCRALTGRNPLPAHLRRYSTELGCARLIRGLGATDVAGVLVRIFPEIPPAQARRGDCGVVLTLVDGKPVPAAVIVLGPTVVGKGPAGAVHRPRADLVTAYAIGSL